MNKRLLQAIIVFFLQCICYISKAQKVADFNLIHHEKGTDSWSSMPLGNGELSAQVWTTQNGEIQSYIARTDSRDAMDQVLKVGKLSIRFEPDILNNGADYTETLILNEGLFRIKNSIADIQIRADANHQALIISGISTVPVTITVTNNIWRNDDRNWNEKEYDLEYGKNKVPFAPYQEADKIIKGSAKGIGWYHRNESDLFWNEVMKANDLLNERVKNPLKNRTFGAWVSGNSFTAKNDTTLINTKPQNEFYITAVVECKQTETPEKFVEGLKQSSEIFRKKNKLSTLASHKKWWNDYWDRSYIFFNADNRSLNDTLTILNRGYILQRYVNAIGGRGNLPIKFNGSTLVLDTYKNNIGRVSGLSADTRLWGGAYWWQNTRLMYYPMLASGDYDLIQPFIKFYWEQLQVAKLMTGKFYKHPGTRMIETSHFWGTWRGYDIGWDRTGLQPGISINPYIKDLIIAGLEMTNYLLDYYTYKKDDLLLREKIIPFAREILMFYDEHYKKDAAGKLIMSPTQSLETYIEGVDPTPDIAGLMFVIPRVKMFADDALLKLCERLEKAIPAIPTREKNGKKVILPIASFKSKINVEYPELYPVFPFRLYGVGKKDNSTAIETFKEKKRDYQGWHQTSIQAAMLGLTDSAAKILVSNGLAFDKRFRFPAFWGPNYDYTPDQCHAGNFINTIQTMILQSAGDDIYLLPAWPANWNVKFKLRAPMQTVVEGEWRNGKWVQNKTIPSQRIKNITTGFQ